MSELIEIYSKLGEAYRLKELFRDFWQFHNKEVAMAFLAYWCDLTEETQIPALKKNVRTLKSHWTGIVNYVESKISNGILEGINNKVQLSKKRARGYRNTHNIYQYDLFYYG